MAKFDSKSFNEKAFGKYVDIVPKLKKNELVKSKALQPNSQIRQAFSGQTGVVYASIPMYGRIDGDALNYDGATDITATSTTTYERGVIVVGRAKAWVENDFSEDVTGGAGFMTNVAKQVAEYWDEVDQDTLLAILEGIFSMTGTANLKFVDGHTYDISNEATAEKQVVSAATLNSAIQKASGDKKSKFTISIMHSVIATNLENLKLLAYMTYTDANGIERQLELATWNGRAVIIDDGMPVEEVEASDAVVAVPGVKAKYTLTVTTKAVADDALAITAGGKSATYICGVDWAAQTSVANDCTELQKLIAADFPDYTVTKTASTVVLEQKVAKTEDAATIIVNKKDSTGTLDAAIAETTEGVTAVAAKDAVAAHTKYTTYVLGNGAFDYEDIGAEVPYAMVRDEKTNGGQTYLYSRQRKVFAPYGISFTKASMASNSPTDAELKNGANWELVHDGASSNKKYIDHKAIPIARIISRG
jgi:hypothetical protein